MAVGIFVTRVENTPTDRAVAQQQLDQMLEKHPRPLAPGLSRRPWSAAYDLGPSVFTIRETR